MAAIADAAGCSRGTLYRYFRNRHELHLAYVKRAGRRIAASVREQLAGVDDPRERVIEYILSAVRAVRDNPGTAAWFEPGVFGLAARMSHSSEVVEHLTAAFGSDVLGLPGRGRQHELRTRWLIRVILSLLLDPEENAAEERTLVERFVAPAWLSDPAI